MSVNSSSKPSNQKLFSWISDSILKYRNYIHKSKRLDQGFQLREYPIWYFYLESVYLNLKMDYRKGDNFYQYISPGNGNPWNPLHFRQSNSMRPSCTRRHLVLFSFISVPAFLVSYSVSWSWTEMIPRICGMIFSYLSEYIRRLLIQILVLRINIHKIYTI